jgi:hypothetical protein
MFGAATGAAIGLGRDRGEAARQAAAQAAEAAGKALQERGPELKAAVGTALARGAEQVRAADLPGRARDLATRAGQSGALDSGREAAKSVAQNAHEIGEKIAEQTQDAVGVLRDSVKFSV